MKRRIQKFVCGLHVIIKNMNIRKKPWSLVEHLRGLGIEPEAPNHPGWIDVENYWGAHFKREETLTPYLITRLTEEILNLPAAPLVVTMYKWAQRNDVDINIFKGKVNADTRVRRALVDYAMSRMQTENVFYSQLEAVVNVLLEQAPLPTAFKAFINNAYNQTFDTANGLTTWLSPITGYLPAISTWKEMAKILNDHYELKPDDTQLHEAMVNKHEPYHWSKNHRMELILAAWLETDSHYLAMPLYNHLPNIAMDTPDDVTAVFWMTANQRIADHPGSVESEMLDTWMKQYPKYQTFVQNTLPLLDALMDKDHVVRGKALNAFWQQRNATPLEPFSVQGLFESSSLASSD